MKNIVYINNDVAPEGFYKTIKLRHENIVVQNTTYVGINKINIFVGSNNSGKSRLLRHIFFSEGKFSKIEDGFNNSLINSINILKDLRGIYGDVLDEDNIVKYFLEFIESSYIHPLNKKDVKLRFFNTLSEQILNLLFSNSDKTPTKKIISENMYIPLLRSLFPIGVYKNDDKFEAFKYSDAYRKRINIQYFENKRDSEEQVFTGQSIFEKLEGMLLGDHGERETVRKYEKFLSQYIFEGKPITLIPKKKSDTVWVRIGDLPEREIHNLGDGIQALILLTFPIFMNKDKDMMFFIEEPEINMHPGMQRIFMNALINLGIEKHYYFFTTHSNHFIDMAFDYDDISIFMFNKYIEKIDGVEQEVFNVENVNCGDIRILRELGVNNSSVFMSNCTIWVEGITDRMYIREYIKRYQEKNKKKIVFTENLHYSFVEYGGSSVSHLEYKDSDDDMVNKENINIKSISNKPIIVADFDGKAKEHIHEGREDKLGKDNYFHIKGVKEIENTLHENILKRVIAEYEKVKDINDIEFKNIDDFKQKKYRNKPLGKFINNELLNKKRKSYADKVKKQFEKDGNKSNRTVDGNTISDKVSFAEKACRYLRDETISYEDSMSESAIQLSKRLYDFIEKSNENILNI